MPDDAQELLSPRGRNLGLLKDRFSISKAADSETGREDAHPIFFSSKQCSLLEPRDSRLHARIIRQLVALKVMVAFSTNNLAGRGNNIPLLARLLIKSAKRFQDCSDFMAGQPRASGQCELPLNVVLSKKQNTLGWFAISACAPRFLQIVLQRTRNVAMDH